MSVKRMVSILLMVCLFCGLFAGCSKKQAPASTDPSTVPTTQNTTAPPETTVPPTTVPEDPNGWIIDEELQNYTGKVRVFSAFKLSLGMDRLIEEFNTNYPNITVEWNTYSNNSDGSGISWDINNMLAYGEVDVIHSFGLNYTYARWEDSLFLDITDKLAAEGIDMVTNWGTDSYQYAGRYYSIPCGGLQYYVAINKNAWDEAELGDIPTEWTWDEYIEASRKMTKTNEDGSVRYGGSSYSSINTIMYCGVQVSGGDLYHTADGKKSNYDDPVVIKALERELNAELVEKIWFPLATYRKEGIKDYHTFLSGQVASTVTCNVVRYMQDPEYTENRDFTVAFAPFPTEEAGQTNYMAGVHTYSHAAIGANCQDETAAWLFTKFFTTYGMKYLSLAGHHSTWRGTTSEDIVQAVFGSEENATKYVDVESFKNTIGRTDKPFWKESWLTEYSRITGTLKDPLFKALYGEMTAEECLKQAAEDANAYITGGNALGLSGGTVSKTGFTYRVNDDGESCTVTGYRNTNNEDVIIPSTIDSYQVTAIGARAFYHCQFIKNIDLPEGITSIGSCAFFSCDSLESIQFPESLLSIENEAFSGCRSLTQVHLPDGLQALGKNVFRDCSKLYDVKLGSSITEIPYRAFAGCYLLRSITIPDSVTTIGESAFSQTGLLSLTVPDSVTTIYKYAFFDCESLESLTLPENVTFLSGFYLGNCRALKSIVIPDTVTELADGAFINCKSLTSIVIPKNVTRIGSKAFAGCSNLTSITLHPGISALNTEVFSGTDKLTDITFNGTLTKWHQISKYYKWMQGSSIQTIHCTNGTSSAKLEGARNIVNEYWSWMNLALTSCYDSAKGVDLYQFFYNGAHGVNSGPSTPSDAEWQQLKKKPGFKKEYKFYRLSAEDMNTALLATFGLTLEETNKVGLENFVYLESTDCYYMMHTDHNGYSNITYYSITESKDGTIKITYKPQWNIGKRVVTLKPTEDGYIVVSNKEK